MHNVPQTGNKRKQFAQRQKTNSVTEQFQLDQSRIRNSVESGFE